MNEAPESWPPELDAMIAAPKHHRLMLENDRVRVLETIVRPGEIVPLHTHCWPAVFHIFGWSDIVRRGPNGEVQADTRGKAAPVLPAVTWSGPLGPHTLENVGSSEVHVISIELKDEAP
jgi:hypothetical protein